MGRAWTDFALNVDNGYKYRLNLWFTEIQMQAHTKKISLVTKTIEYDTSILSVLQ